VAAAVKIKAVARAKGGVLHALRVTHASEAFCGWMVHNFNKRIGLEHEDYGNGYSYVPPENIFPTCIECIVVAGRS